MSNLVRVKRLSRFYCAADWSWKVHGQSHWTREQQRTVPFNFNLWTVLQGKGWLKASADTYRLQAGDCFILRGDESYRAGHDPRDPLVVFAVHFDFIDENGRPARPSTQLHRRIQDFEFFVHLLEHMETAWQELRKEDADVWLSACLLEAQQGDRGLPVHGFKRQQMEKIRTLCARIMREPGRAWRVSELAAELHCSRSHFSRIFRQATGVPPQAFLVNARIEAAKGLLHASSYSIGRIAEMLGYSDVFFFSRQFKQKTGRSPSTYQRASVFPSTER